MKNATFYTFTDMMPPDQIRQQCVDLSPFKRCESQQKRSHGWVNPFPLEEGLEAADYVHGLIGRTMFLALKIEEKIIPPQAVREEVARVVQARESEQMRRIGKSEKTDIKDEIIMGMMVHAPTKSKIVYGCINYDTRQLIVFTSSNPEAEDFTTALRDALGSLPIHPLRTVRPPHEAMTQWVRGESYGNPPAPFSPQECCTLKSPEIKGGELKVKNMAMESQAVQDGLEAGMLCTELALSHEDAIHFTLTDGLVMKSIKFADLLDEVEDDRTALWLTSQKVVEMMATLVAKMGGLQTES